MCSNIGNKVLFEYCFAQNSISWTTPFDDYYYYCYYDAGLEQAFCLAFCRRQREFYFEERQDEHHTETEMISPHLFYKIVWWND